MKIEECTSCPKHTCETNTTIVFDSAEEEMFWFYLEELKENDYIDNFEYNTSSFTLSKPITYTWIENKKTKNVIKESILLHGHIYTPDFVIFWNKKSEDIFYRNINSQKKLDILPFISIQLDFSNGKGYQSCSVIEIKPSFDYQNMTRLSIINQKWMMEQHGIYVQKIIPTGKSNSLFAKTFVPQKCLLTKKTKKTKSYKFPVRTLEEFINGNV